MKRFKLIDECFSYVGKSEFGEQTGYAAINRIPKHVEWVHNGFGKWMETYKELSPTDETFYTEKLIDMGLHDNVSSKKYAWLIEPRWYNQMASKIKSNPRPYIDAYDAIFTHDKELLDLDSTFKFVIGQGSVIEEIGLFEKTKLVSCIVSEKTMSDGHNLRLQFARELEKTGQVDMYGKAFNYIHKKIDSIKDYMFSFAMENDFYPSYFTEKLNDCFLTGTIPIYLGPPNIGDFYNIDGIIVIENDNGNVSFNSDILSKEYYYEHIDAIKDNYERALLFTSCEDFMFLNYFNE